MRVRIAIRNTPTLDPESAKIQTVRVEPRNRSKPPRVVVGVSRDDATTLLLAIDLAEWQCLTAAVKADAARHASADDEESQQWQS